MATGGAVAVVGVVVAALALLFTGRPVQPPDLVGPAQGSSRPAPPSSTPPSSQSATATPTPDHVVAIANTDTDHVVRVPDCISHPVPDGHANRYADRIPDHPIGPRHVRATSR